MEKRRGLRLLLSYVGRYKKHIAVPTVFGAASALLSVGFSLLLRALINSTVSGVAPKELLSLGVWVLLAIALQTILTAVSEWIGAKLRICVTNEIKADMFSKISRGEYRAQSVFHSGDLMTRIGRDVPHVTSFLLDALPLMFTLSVQFLASLIVLFMLDSVMCAIALAAGPVLLLLSVFFGRKIRGLQKNVMKKEGEQTGFLQEALQNMTLIRAFSMQGHHEKKLRALQEDYKEAVLARTKVSLLSKCMLGLLSWAAYIAAFSWAVYRLYNKTIGFGDVTAFLQLSAGVRDPLTGMAPIYAAMLTALASIERMEEILLLQEEDKGENPTDGAFLQIRGENISFSYTPEKPVLENLSFCIPKGTFLGICGPSGQGKTTLMYLLLGLLKPQKGVLMLEGEGVASISAATRCFFSYVPQGNTLFSGTVRENVLFGEEKTEDEIEAALSCACALDFVKKLPQGADTVIGEKGVGLSEGQAQRIAIARAILRGKEILLLDEAASALDEATEKRLVQNIKQAYRDKTVIWITHRKSISVLCDAVLEV